MARYAQGTAVPAGRSREELERTLARFGATGFGYMQDRGDVTVFFRAKGLAVRFRLQLPDMADVSKTPTGRRRASSALTLKWEQECRSRWRALVLLVKAKLVGVEAGIVTFEEEFLANVVTAGGETVAERILPQLASGAAGELRLLPAPREARS